MSSWLLAEQRDALSSPSVFQWAFLPSPQDLTETFYLNLVPIIECVSVCVCVCWVRVLSSYGCPCFDLTVVWLCTVTCVILMNLLLTVTFLSNVWINKDWYRRVFIFGHIVGNCKCWALCHPNHKVGIGHWWAFFFLGRQWVIQSLASLQWLWPLSGQLGNWKYLSLLWYFDLLTHRSGKNMVCLFLPSASIKRCVQGWRDGSG